MALLVQMLRARRAQAMILLVLSSLATAAAVAGPAALTAVDRAIIRHEVTAANPGERSVRWSWQTNAPLDSAVTAATGPLPGELAGFDRIYAVQFPIMGIGPLVDLQHLEALTFREDVCAHLTMVRGRCLMGTYEVVIGEQTATRHDLVPGSVLHTDEVDITMFGEVLPHGNPRTMVVVGVYRASNPAELYWGPHGFGNRGAGEREPVFTDRATIGYANSWYQVQSIDLILPTELLTSTNLASVRRGVDVARGAATLPDVAIDVSSQVPALIDRIETGRRVAHALLPVAFVPLVAFCLYVMFFAVNHSAAARRQELGLTALRGVPRVRRWWFATGEPLIAIAAGAPIGYYLGTTAVAWIAAWRFDDAIGTPEPMATAPYATAVFLAAAGTCVLGQRHLARAPVMQLLRGVPPRSSAVRTTAIEVSVVALAVLATFQLRAVNDGLVGIASLVPAFVIASVALLAGRASVPVTAWSARLALRRGWLGWALATVQLIRRPGSHGMLVLLTVATALLGFAVAGLDVASRARHERAAIQTGAPTVVTIDPVDARTLLAAVRSVDPAGSFAMSVAQAPTAARNRPPVLAVDTSRLAAVAVWRSGYGVDPARLAAVLRPGAPEPFVLRGTRVSVDLDRPVTSDGSRHGFVMTFAPLAGGPAVDAAVGAVAAGRQTYTVPVPACANGCRIASLRAVTDGGQPVSIVLRAVREPDTDTVVVAPSDLADPQRWRSGSGTLVTPRGDGLELIGGPAAAAGIGLATASDARVVDAPVPLPVATAGAPPPGAGVVGFDQGLHEAVLVARPAMLPRVGSAGSLVDLEYLDRTTLRPSTLAEAQVWLGPAAPADAVDRLRAAGLPVTGLVRAADQERALANQGSAMVLWFYLLAGGLSVLLGICGVSLMSAADRHRQANDLRQLRRQGLSRRDMLRASRWGGLLPVVVGGVFGVAATWLAWLATGADLPVFVDDNAVVAPPRWPGPAAVLWPCAVAVALFAAAVMVTTAQLRRTVARDTVVPG